MAHHHYRNLDDVNVVLPLSAVLRWQKERFGKKRDYSYIMPQAAEKEREFLVANRTEPTLTWIGHTTFLLQLDGFNLLTDPVWAGRMGFQRRLAQPGLALKDLPPIDAVLLSHNHYDHLHLDTLRRLGRHVPLFVPAGLAAWLHAKDFSCVQELSWWETASLGRLTLHFVPAQHWSRRTLWDTNHSHWGGWVLQSADGPTVYYAGDSGYFRGFAEVGRRLAPDYFLAPTGAYEPGWFMQTQHASPEQAVQAYLDCGARFFLPMHHDAFPLGDETTLETLNRLKTAWQQRGLPPDALQLPLLGETLRLS